MEPPVDLDHLDHLRNVQLWRSPGPGDNRGWTWLVGNEGVEIILRGRSWLEVHGHRHELGVGAMVWGQPGDRTLSAVDPAAPYHTLLIRFATTRASRTPAPRLAQWGNPEELQAFATEALELFRARSFDPRWFPFYLYTRLRWQVHRATTGTGLDLAPAPLRAALAAIERRHSERLLVADLARAAGLGATALHQLFRRHLGCTPLEALVRRRIQAACALLLAEPDLAVATVGARCGFGDAVHFGRVFRARQGCTPGIYRRRHAEGG